MNIPAPLLPLFDQGLLDEVVRPLMSGKEASVYLVQSKGQRCVAKVYKEATNRSFRQRAVYAEGRQVRNSRQRRAMAKGTKYGKALLEDEWQNSEVQALYRLYDAGVRVPVPYHHAENVLLMELVADANGEPAPRLYDAEFEESLALALHERLIREVVGMLCAGLVHGDLSEYNILLDDYGPVIIDLPQTTDAARNQNSEMLFLRDVANLSRFLGRFAPSLKKTQYGPEIWDLFVRAELHPDVELTGRFKAVEKRVDAQGVIAEIQAAEAEASERPLSAYQLKKQRKAEEARLARAEEERRAQRAEQAQKDRAKASAGRPKAAPHRDGAPKKSASDDRDRSNGDRRTGGARSGDRRNAGSRSGDIRNGGPRNGDTRNAGPRNGDARNGGARNGGARNGGARNGGARNGGARNAGPRNGAPNSGAPNPQGAKADEAPGAKSKRRRSRRRNRNKTSSASSSTPRSHT